MSIRNQILVFIAGGLVFGGITFWLTSTSEHGATESKSQTYTPNPQVAEDTLPQRREEAQDVASTTVPQTPPSEAHVIHNQDSATPSESETSLVESLEDGRMLINSEQFSQMVNAQDFALQADAFVYRHPVSKSQQAYETEAELERLLLEDDRLRELGSEVAYFKCSNDYCVLSVDTDGEEEADGFFSYFANPDHEYANFVQGGGNFSIIASDNGAAARLAFGISDKFN